LLKVREVFEKPVDLHAGEKVGQFSLGSSIVLLFEAPPGLVFVQRALQKIHYGEHLL
jgi:phosphatidylserine decarboxylase